MDLGLQGRVALIAGGSKGMGAASARVLAAQGAKVALLSRNPAEEIAQAIGADGGEAVPFAGDLTRPGDCEKVVAATIERFGRLDIAVASAGAAQGGIFWEIGDEAWQAALDLKLMGTVRFLRAVIPPMREAGYGRVVVIVGNAGKQPGARFLPGSAANAACLALVKGLADEVARDGIVVNAVNPGPTRTDRWRVLIDNLARATGRTAAEIEYERLDDMPMGRIGEPEEIARLVAVLASDLAAMVTGTSITADGGATKALA